VQLGNACLALAAAASLSSQPAEAEAALRTAVKQLRWVLGVGQEDLRRLSAAGEHPEVRVGRKGAVAWAPGGSTIILSKHLFRPWQACLECTDNYDCQRVKPHK
jgi:hypothetical protein